MSGEFRIREASFRDIEATFHVRANTRENAIPRERLASLGITPGSVEAAIKGGSYRSWVCDIDGKVVGFCNVEGSTGEVIVLAVLSGYEGRGIGRVLLSEAVQFLRAAGNARIWLTASPLESFRSHGFYRANGWKPTGIMGAYGDEELEYVVPGRSFGAA